MTKLTVTKPEVGQKNTTEEPKVGNALTALELWANGEIDTFNLKNEGIEEADLAAAVKTLLNAKVSGLSYIAKNEATFTAATGELVAMEKANSVLTLPEPTVNRVVGVVGAAFGGQIKVKPTKVATKIFGSSLSEAGAAEVALTGGQLVIFYATGTNWFIPGEPKHEQFFGVQTSRISGTEYEPSASRPVYVVLEGNAVGEWKAQVASTVGTLTLIGASKGPAAIGFPINPGQKWKVTTLEGSPTYNSAYLIQ